MGLEGLVPSPGELNKRYPRRAGIDEEGRTTYKMDVAELTASSSKLDTEMPYADAAAQDKAINNLLNPIVQDSFNMSDSNIETILARYGEGIGVASPAPETERSKQIKARREKYEQELAGEVGEARFGLLQEDLDRLITMGPAEVENLRDLATLAMRMYHAGPEGKEQAQSLLHLFKDYRPFHHLIEVETNYQTTFEDLYEPPSGPNPVLSAIGWTFGVLMKPVDTVIPMVLDFTKGDFKSLASRFAQAGIDLTDFLTPDFVTDKGILASAESWLEEHESDLGDYDLNDDGRISIKESKLNPLSDVPVVGAVTDLLAEIMLDPLTWGTLGVGSLVKGAMKAGGKTILSASVAPGGARKWFIRAGAVKKGGLVDKLSDDAFQQALYRIKDGFDNSIPWKKLRKQIADDLGDEYSDELLDEILTVVMSGSRTGRQFVKQARLLKKHGKAKEGSVRKERLTTRIEEISKDLNIGDDGISQLINDKSRQIGRRIKQIKRRQGGGLGFGAGAQKYYVPGTRKLYQWFKRNGIAITPAKFFWGSRKIPTLFGKGRAGISPTGDLVDDLHMMGWAADVMNSSEVGRTVHKADGTVEILASGTRKVGGWDAASLQKAWNDESLNLIPRKVGIDPATGELVETVPHATPDVAFNRRRTVGAPAETEGGRHYKRPHHPDENLRLREAIDLEEAEKILSMLEEAGALRKNKWGRYESTWGPRAGPKEKVRYEGRHRGGEGDPRLISDPADPRAVEEGAFIDETLSGERYSVQAVDIEEWINNPFRFAPPEGVDAGDLFEAVEKRIDKIDDYIDEVGREIEYVDQQLLKMQADLQLGGPLSPDEVTRLEALRTKKDKLFAKQQALNNVAQELTDQQYYIQALIDRNLGWDDVASQPIRKEPADPNVFSDEAIEGAETVADYRDPVVEGGPRIVQSEGPVTLSQEARDEVRREVYEEYGIKINKDGSYDKRSKAWKDAKKKLGIDADDATIEGEVRTRAQQANQDVKERIANRQKPIAKAEQAGEKNKVKRLIESQKSNPRNGTVVKRIEQIHKEEIPYEEITNRDRRRIERHERVLLPGRSAEDGTLRPSDFFRRAEAWAENKATGGLDADLFEAEQIGMWGVGVQRIGDEKTVKLASGKTVDVVHPTGSADLPTPRNKIAITDTRESAEKALIEELGDWWDKLPEINELAPARERAARKANRAARGKSHRKWKNLSDDEKKYLIQQELITERVSLSRRGAYLKVSEDNYKVWYEVRAALPDKVKLNPTTSFGPEDVGSYKPLGYFDVETRSPEFPPLRSTKPVGYETNEAGARSPVHTHQLDGEHAWNLIRTNLDSMIDILGTASDNNMGTWSDILGVLEDADWDDSLVHALTDTPFGEKGLRDPSESMILGSGPPPGPRTPPRSVMPLSLSDMLGEQTRLYYQKAAPKGLMAKSVDKVTKPFFGTVRYGLKKTEGLRSFIKLGKQGNKLEREVARESKSRSMANARMEHDTRMTVLTKYRKETEKMMKRHGTADSDGALIRWINAIRQPKANREAIYKEGTGAYGEEIAERVKRIVTELDNYSATQLEIIEDTISKQLLIKNPDYDRTKPSTTIQYDDDGVAIPTKKGVHYNPEFIPLDPESYTPRVLTPEAEKAFVDIFKDNGDPAMKQYRTELTEGESIRGFIEDAGKDLGWDHETVEQAIQEWGNLFGGLKDAGGRVAPESLNGSLNAARMMSTLVESGHMKARAFLPQIQNVQELNEFINTVLTNIADNVKKLKEGGEIVEGWGVTRFYEEDPIDAFIRYSSSFQHQHVVYDFLNDMEVVFFNDIMDEATGLLTDRPAVFESTLEVVPPLKGGVREFADGETVVKIISEKPQYKLTFKDLDGNHVIMRSQADETMDEFSQRVRKRVSQQSGGANYEVVKVGSGFRIVDGEVAREIEDNIIGQLKNHHLQSTTSQIINRWTTGWATYATVPLIGLAFHMRNAVGNFFNMAVAGMKNPAVVIDAMRIQALNRGVKQWMKREGYLSYDEALDAIVKKQGEGLNTVVKGIERVSEKDRLTLRMIRDSAIVNPGFFQDLGRDVGIFDRKGGTNFAQKTGNAYINNPLTSSGRKFGSLIEDNARIALFLDGVNRGMDVAEAGMRTKEFLFDYTELTHGERKIKIISRFYTWMRKNTALQMRMMVSQPGSVWNTQKMVDGIVRNVFGATDDFTGSFQPEWAKDRGWLYNPNDMFMVRMETPLISAIETFEKVAYLGSIGDVNPLIPWDYENISLSDRLGDTVGLLASGPQSGITAYVEEIMGKSMYSGATLNDNSAWAQVYRLGVTPVVPVVSKFLREMAKWSGKDPLGLVSDHQEMESWWSDEDKRSVRLGNFFFGVSSYSLNEEQQFRLIGYLRGEYDDIRQEFDKAGINIPTLADLQYADRYNEADRVAKILIFSQSSAARVDDALNEQVWDILEDYGLPREAVPPKDDKTLEEHQEAIRIQIALATEVLNRGSVDGKPLTFPPEWKLKIALGTAGGLNNAELEALGIEPLRENQFLNSETEEEDILRMSRWLDMTLRSAGVSRQQAEHFMPLIPEAVRYVRDKVELGVDLNDAIWEYIFELSRRKRQLLGIPLDVYDYEKTLSAREIQQLIKKTRESVAEIMLLSWAWGIEATEQEIQHWIIHGNSDLPNASKERLGYGKSEKQIQREDPRDEGEKLRDDMITLEALGVGIGAPA